MNQSSSSKEHPYSSVDTRQLILRDVLAVDRTVLANERTVLAYVRTALTFFLSGITIIKFLYPDSYGWFLVGWVFIVVAVMVLIFGFWRFAKTQWLINSLREASLRESDDGDGAKRT